MAGTPYLVDSNVLLRWIKPDDRDDPLVVSAIDPLFSAVLCSATRHRTLLQCKSTQYEQIRGARDLNHNRLGFAEATG